MPLPDYIKIDVDGIEHKIIEGCNKILKNKKLSSLLIEINENRKEDQLIIEKLKESEQKTICVINKIDQIEDKDNLWSTKRTISESSIML